MPDLTLEDFVPRGSTPLCDALAATINAVDASMQGRKARVVIAVQTDGRENCSREHSWNSVRALVDRKTKEGWEFKFLGAGLEANSYQQAGQMGLGRGATVAYNKHDKKASMNAFAATAQNIRAFAEGLAMSTDYTPAQKLEAGDVEDGALVSDAPGNWEQAMQGMPHPFGLPSQPGLDHFGLPATLGQPRDWLSSTGAPAPNPLTGTSIPSSWPVRPVAIASPARAPLDLTTRVDDEEIDDEGVANPEPFVLDVYGEEERAKW